MNRAFGGSEGGREGGRRHCCRTNFLQRGISPSHPSIYPSAHPHSVRPFLLLPSSSCGAGGAPTRRTITRICEGKYSFSYSSESEERCGRCNNRSHAMQLCNCRWPANCPANRPTPTRSASETRGEGWSGDWNYGTMEGGGLAVGAGDDNIRLALVRPPPLLPPLSHTL